MKFVNKNQIKEAVICKTDNNKWKLVLIMGYNKKDYPNEIIIDCKSEDDCNYTALRLGLTNI